MLARFGVVHIESSTSLQECPGAHFLTRNMLRDKRGSKHSTAQNVCATGLEPQLYQGRLLLDCSGCCSGTLMNRQSGRLFTSLDSFQFNSINLHFMSFGDSSASFIHSLDFKVLGPTMTIGPVV